MVKQLILFFALTTGLPVFAQHFKTDTFIVRNRVLNKFVKKCKALDTLGFNMQAYNGLYMTPRPDVHFPLKSIRNKEYSLPYKGDQYRFEKAFGIFPENELLKTIDQYKKNIQIVSTLHSVGILQRRNVYSTALHGAQLMTMKNTL